MIKNKNITVVICLYNAENYIKETLESIKNQSFKDFKILIIDDKSKDNSLNVCKNYLEKNFTDFLYSLKSLLYSFLHYISI